MATYKIKFNIEGGKSLELDLNKEEFERVSDLCEKVLPNKDWKTETLKAIEA